MAIDIKNTGQRETTDISTGEAQAPAFDRSQMVAVPTVGVFEGTPAEDLQSLSLLPGQGSQPDIVVTTKARWSEMEIEGRRYRTLEPTEAPQNLNFREIPELSSRPDEGSDTIEEGFLTNTQTDLFSFQGHCPHSLAMIPTDEEYPGTQPEDNPGRILGDVSLFRRPATAAA